MALFTTTSNYQINWEQFPGLVPPYLSKRVEDILFLISVFENGFSHPYRTRLVCFILSDISLDLAGLSTPYLSIRVFLVLSLVRSLCLLHFMEQNSLYPSFIFLNDVTTPQWRHTVRASGYISK